MPAAAAAEHGRSLVMPRCSDGIPNTEVADLVAVHAASTALSSDQAVGRLFWKGTAWARPAQRHSHCRGHSQIGRRRTVLQPVSAVAILLREMRYAMRGLNISRTCLH